MNFGGNLKRLRELRGITQVDLADHLNIDRTKLNKIESGFQKRIEPELLVDLAESLGVGVEDLVGSTRRVLSKDRISVVSIDDWLIEVNKASKKKKQVLRVIWEQLKEM